jgi:hypothetical protein
MAAEDHPCPNMRKRGVQKGHLTRTALKKRKMDVLKTLYKEPLVGGKISYDRG